MGENDDLKGYFDFDSYYHSESVMNSDHCDPINALLEQGFAHHFSSLFVEIQSQEQLNHQKSPSSSVDSFPFPFSSSSSPSLSPFALLSSPHNHPSPDQSQGTVMSTTQGPSQKVHLFDQYLPI